MEHRTVVLGMNNPLSADPRHALYPHPPGCAGHRLWSMLATEALVPEPPEVVTQQKYCRALDRRNVLSARAWSAADARREAGRLLDSLAPEEGDLFALEKAPPDPVVRRIVILGVGTLRACGLPRPAAWGAWASHYHLPTLRLEYCLLPHPSGRCREYNDPDMVRLAGQVLLAEYRRSSQLGDRAAIDQGDTAPLTDH